MYKPSRKIYSMVGYIMATTKISWDLSSVCLCVDCTIMNWVAHRPGTVYGSEGSRLMVIAW